MATPWATAPNSRASALPRPAQHRVDVAPVYLAGPGSATTVTDALRAEGWSATHTAVGALYTSPCLRAHVVHLPEHWKITYARTPLEVPAWSAQFSREAPAEVVAAFTSALADSLPADHRPLPETASNDRGSGPRTILNVRGWRKERLAHYRYHHSPDGHAYLRLNLGEMDFHAELEGEVSAAWSMYACVEAVNGPR
ncbi:DUF317 domain-containing protein [Streptomyces sp. NPDC050095]|uniref:DUF317 domain-containing protein n=1 Tax=unclassified Streptomyces TaxID=2593676 RepID=UPI00341D5E17